MINSGNLGKNLILIAKRLCANQKLCKYLFYTDENPQFNEDIENVQKTILNNNIKVVPIVKETENNLQSTLCLVYPEVVLDSDNVSYVNVALDVLIYVPLRQWIINEENLRPFSIISEVEESLKGKTVEGVGRLVYNGFELNLLTSELSCYKMSFRFDDFS